MRVCWERGAGTLEHHVRGFHYWLLIILRARSKVSPSSGPSLASEEKGHQSQVADPFTGSASASPRRRPKCNMPIATTIVDTLPLPCPKHTWGRSIPTYWWDHYASRLRSWIGIEKEGRGKDLSGGHLSTLFLGRRL